MNSNLIEELERSYVAKKSKKKRLRKRQMKTTQGAKVRTPVKAQERVVRVQKDFQPDYTYVIKDLKRIGVLAGSFVTILIVLSLFLR
jgi:hypothetical protein